MNEERRCAACSQNNRCRKLTVNQCLGDKCSFFQTADEAAMSRAKADSRLRSLDKETQMYIADKYYGSEMPWMAKGDA